jgi:HEAT repeat protein
MALARILENDEVNARQPELRQPILHQLLMGCLHPARKTDRPWAALAVGIALNNIERGSALKTLGKQKLRELLRRTNQPQDLGAVTLALGLLRDGRSVEPILDQLEDCHDDDLRVHLIQSLGLLGQRKAVQPLAKLTADRKTRPRVRIEAARALYLLGDAAPLASLVDLTAADSSSELLASVTGALAALRTADAVDPLLALLQDPKQNDRTKVQVARALGYLGDLSEASWFTPYSVDSNFYLSVAPMRLLNF